MSENKKNNSNGSWGCFIIVFLMIAAGIPAATKGEGPIGTIVIVILGIALAWYIAKALSGKD